MTAFLVDQNFNEKILDGLTRHDAVLIRVYSCSECRFGGSTRSQDTGMGGRARVGSPDARPQDDSAVRLCPSLSRLAHAGRFLVDDQMPIGQAIDELLLAAHCLSRDECKNILKYFPMG